MNLKFLSTLVVIGLIGNVSAQVLVSDDFSTGVDSYTNNWNPLTPFTNQIIYDWTAHDVYSTVTQSNGYVTLLGGASLNSIQSFSSPYIFTASFEQTSNPGGRTQLTLRGDGFSTDPTYGHPVAGIDILFFGDSSNPNEQGNNSQNWQLQLTQDGTPVSETYFNPSMNITMDSITTFSITDYGTNLSVNINGVLAATAIVSTNDFSFGGNVSIGSQWSDTGGTGLQVYRLSVQPVPEPSTYALIGIATIGLLIVRRRKNTA